MRSHIRIVIRYQIKKECIVDYEKIMTNISSELQAYGAENVIWYQYSPKGEFQETFIIPTEAHYFAIKQRRFNENHAIFGLLHPFLDGGIKTMQSWALRLYR